MTTGSWLATVSIAELCALDDAAPSTIAPTRIDPVPTASVRRGRAHADPPDFLNTELIGNYPDSAWSLPRLAPYTTQSSFPHAAARVLL